MDNKWLIESQMVFSLFFKVLNTALYIEKRVLDCIANHDYSVVFEASLRIRDSRIRLCFLSLIIY